LVLGEPRGVDAILAIPSLFQVQFDRSSTPSFRPAPSDEAAARARALPLLSLACAFGTGGDRLVAVLDWTANLIPFGGLGLGYAFESPWQIPRARRVLSDTEIKDVEQWCQILDAHHVGGIDVALRRTVSALSLRLDRADALIDAVTAWENLVGTRAETVFRVTGALAKLLEPDRSRRMDIRRRLQKVYDTRSRVIHGDAVDMKDLELAAREAVNTALGALQASYRRGPEWLTLTSSERADRLLLQEP
jgi:hypothetical protein